jgi:predicted NUDIX family NTP pyrophosphohydrolase
MNQRWAGILNDRHLSAKRTFPMSPERFSFCDFAIWRSGDLANENQRTGAPQQIAILKNRQTAKWPDNRTAKLVESAEVQQSAGLLMYRLERGSPQVLLVHPGGPFWARKDRGAWTIPKGLIGEGEEPLAAAQREFQEETGFVPSEPYHALGAVKLKSGKTVHAWAFQGTCDPKSVRSQTFQLEWPPRSGRFVEVPEVDNADFFTIEEARLKLNPAQVPFLDALLHVISLSGNRQ